VALFAFCLIGQPRIAQAVDFKLFGLDFTFNATTTAQYEWRGDNDFNKDRQTGKPFRDTDDDLHYVFHTLDFSLAHGAIRFGGRLDMHLYFNTYFESSSCPSGPGCRDGKYRFVDYFYTAHDKDGDPGRSGARLVIPERLFLTINKPQFDLTIGDFYASLGNGIALNVVKLDELGNDTTVRGMKFAWHSGNLNALFIAGMFNFLDVDQATGFISRELFPEELVVGGRVAYKFADTIDIGVHGLHIVGMLDNVQNERHNTIAGLTFEMPNLLDGDLSVKGEVDVQRTARVDGCVVRGFDEDRSDDGCSRGGFGVPDHLHTLRGVAAYMSSTYSREDWTFNIEGKYFSDFEVGLPNTAVTDFKSDAPSAVAYPIPYAQPPTLERIYANVTDVPSSAGGRVRIDYNFGEVGPIELLVYFNYTFLATFGEGNYHIHDPYVGFELQWQGSRGHWNLMSGARYEEDASTGKKHRLDIHLFGDIEQPLFKRHSLAFTYFFRRNEKEVVGLLKWTEMDLALSYKWSPYISLAFTLEHTSDPAVGALSADADPDQIFAGEWMLGAQVRYFFTPSTYVNFRIGQNRPGLKCIQGICRLLPGFSGAQVLVVGRL
jgi:hypothetical protein